MSARRQERLVNLTICLLATRRFLTRAQIRQAVSGYADLTEAGFERAFERDKDELRQLGLPIEVGSNEPLFDDEPGYRIRRDEVELPAVELTQDEATAVALAAGVWQRAAWGEATRAALTKLRAAGAQPDARRLAALQPAFSARGPNTSEATVDILAQGILERRECRFAYNGSQRRVHPWHLSLRRGSFYLRAFDLDRREDRLFKLFRFESEPQLVGREAAYEIPAGLAVEATRGPEPSEPTRIALVALGAGAPASLRRRGTFSDQPSPVPGMLLYEIPYADDWGLVAELCATAPEAIAVAPEDLRRACVRHLQGVAGVR